MEKDYSNSPHIDEHIKRKTGDDFLHSSTVVAVSNATCASCNNTNRITFNVLNGISIFHMMYGHFVKF